MNVVYASNDGYARHLGASMYSLFDRNQLEEEITVYVLSMGLSEDNRRKLGEIAEHFDRNLVILEMGNLKERFASDIDTGGFDISAMGRLFIGTALPEEIGRALYLDCDTIVLGSSRFSPSCSLT